MIQFELETDRDLFEQAMKSAQQQVGALLDRYPSFYPMYTEKGRWKHDKPAWTPWCDGFLPGMMWIFQRSLGPGSPEAEAWMDRAMAYTTPLAERRFDEDIHDLGFLFMPTYQRWFLTTRQPELNEVLVQAGQTMALRFRERGQYLRSFVAENSLFIDIIMNVGIIFYAARETGDRMLRDIAVRHALTTRRVLVRGDGSTAHEGIFHLDTGEFLRQSTQQGYRADSCWSRGLGWALYGFNSCYEHSRDPRFLETAQSCADYYITHCPADGVPPWDFNAPPETRKTVDTSAAAIAAAGILRLCRQVPDPMKGHLYWTSGLRILRALCEKYLVAGKRGEEGILSGGVYHMHRDLGVNESVIWGDYFFVEALDLALRQLRA
ncbi:MAG TPA: glycoside hydrolase family 88 protein [Bryobacteraceae bacterium]|nr:glycoside hydrolase family 88 protein [Bryobacteraceae bacterium]